MVTLVVDKREHRVLAELRSQSTNFSVTVEEAVLDIGDFHVVVNDNVHHVIERKTCSDLLSSLVDGRYKEQSFRLQEHAVDNKDIYYVIESNNLSRDQRLVSCVFSLNKKGFSVFRTRDVKDTAYFLLGLATKAQKECTTQKNPVSYTSTISKNKKKLDKLYVTVSVYSALPKISTKTAEALQEKYPHVEGLINALRKEEDVVTQLQVNGRRISSAAVDSMRKYLLASTTEENKLSSEENVRGTVEADERGLPGLTGDHAHVQGLEKK